MKNNLPYIIIALAIIIFGAILGRSYIYKVKNRHRVSVAGSASYNFTANLIVWSGFMECQSKDLKDAYSKLKHDAGEIETYLKSRGIIDSEIKFSAISTEKQFEDKYTAEGRIKGKTFNGYRLVQNVTIESKHIDKVEKISREITELLQQGIEFNSQEPSYYYTQLADLKIDLLAKASLDAYNRAKTIADNAHGKLGAMKEANMGVFQITGQYSKENYTYSGALNTSSKNKTANVIVRMEYELE